MEEQTRKTLGQQVLKSAEKGRLFQLINLIHSDRSLVHYTDADGYTALHRSSYANQLDCAKLLVKYGANIEARTQANWTPLHSAVKWNNIEVAQFLVSRGADVNAKSDGGNTPLHIAASNGRFSITCDIIQLLLYNPACDYTIRNESGDTAFDIARRSGPLWRLWEGVMTIWPKDLSEEDKIEASLNKDKQDTGITKESSRCPESEVSQDTSPLSSPSS